ncbi:MAG TPA: thioredoxin domain-containing protein [Thermoanaerobaculia bacterium]
MNRALLVATFLVGSLAGFTASAQSADPNAPLKAYAEKVLARCPGGNLVVEPQAGAAPAGFSIYTVTVRSTDQYCGQKKYLIYSKKTQQVVIGSIIQLAKDNRPVAARISDEASRMLGKPVTATIAPFPLPDGLKSVSITRETPFGPFSYLGFVDSAERFLIVGFRGLLTNDPAKVLRDALGSSTGARRGNAASKVEILELSDFQCPTCANAHAKVEPLIQKNLGKINYVRLDLPLFEHHEWAVQAAMGARALQRVAPAKYWSYVDYIFKNQEQIGTRNNFDAVLKEWLEDNDVSWDAVNKIYSNKSERTLLLDQVSRAFSVGIASTPTFIVNGQIMGFGPEGQFTMDAIKAAVASAPAPAAKKAAPAKKPATKKSAK